MDKTKLLKSDLLIFFVIRIPIDLLEFLATQKCSIGLNYVFAEL